MSSKAVVVRRALLADAPAIGEAHAEAWSVAYAHLFDARVLAKAVAERRARWPRNFERSWFEHKMLLVVELDGRVVGFAHFGPDSASPGGAEIYGFYLHPDAWGSGAADRLMAEALGELSANNLTPITLWTHPGAARARSFYRRAGFVETGRTKTIDLVAGPPVPGIELRHAPGCLTD